MTWTPMLGVMVMVVVVMMTERVRSDYPDNSGDLHLLERAINDTAAKLDLLQEEYSVVSAFVGANLNLLATLVGQINGLISNSDSEDSALDNMIARVDKSRISLEIQAGRVASALSTAKANNERYKQSWQDVDDLNAGNNYQSAKLQGMFELSDILSLSTLPFSPVHVEARNIRSIVIVMLKSELDVYVKARNIRSIVVVMLNSELDVYVKARNIRSIVIVMLNSELDVYVKARNIRSIVVVMLKSELDVYVKARNIRSIVVVMLKSELDVYVEARNIRPIVVVMLKSQLDSKLSSFSCSR
ncbi:hypothetical protein ACOMHN_067328 [Nucella lapillus]